MRSAASLLYSMDVKSLRKPVSHITFQQNFTIQCFLSVVDFVLFLGFLDYNYWVLCLKDKSEFAIMQAIPTTCQCALRMLWHTTFKCKLYNKLSFRDKWQNGKRINDHTHANEGNRQHGTQYIHPQCAGKLPAL